MRKTSLARSLMILALYLLSILLLSACDAQAQGQNAQCIQSPDCHISQNQSGGGSDGQPDSASGQQTRQAPSPPPTPKPVTPGQILCQADWPQGMDGWSGSSDWKSYNGELLNDGSGDADPSIPTIIAPCQMQTGDYAIELKLRIIRNEYDMPAFGVEARGNGSNFYDFAAGYHSADSDVCINSSNNASPMHVVDVCNYTPLASLPWTLDTAWHTYRFELKGTGLKLFIDGAPVLQTQDFSFLSGWQVGIASAATQLEIRDFEVIAL